MKGPEFDMLGRIAVMLADSGTEAIDDPSALDDPCGQSYDD